MRHPFPRRKSIFRTLQRGWAHIYSFLPIKKFQIYVSQAAGPAHLAFAFGWPIKDQFASTWLILEETWRDAAITLHVWASPGQGLRWGASCVTRMAVSRPVRLLSVVSRFLSQFSQLASLYLACIWLKQQKMVVDLYRTICCEVTVCQRLDNQPSFPGNRQNGSVRNLSPHGHVSQCKNELFLSTNKFFWMIKRCGERRYCLWSMLQTTKEKGSVLTCVEVSSYKSWRACFLRRVCLPMWSPPFALLLTSGPYLYHLQLKELSLAKYRLVKFLCCLSSWLASP